MVLNFFLLGSLFLSFLELNSFMFFSWSHAEFSVVVESCNV